MWRIVIRNALYYVKIWLASRFRLKNEARTLMKQSKLSPYSEAFSFDKNKLVIRDYYETAGVASGHYFHQDLFVAKEVLRKNPIHHFDIGSRIDGFVSHVAVFRRIEIFDIRPLKSSEPNIVFHQLDIMNKREVAKIPKISSLSCLHTAEHFGLGRYGDSIDFDGWHVGIQNMTSLLESGGTFYFSTPVSDRQRVIFNTHRIFRPDFLMEYFSKDFEIIKTVAVRDSGSLDLDADFSKSEFLATFKDTYACGIWVLKKK